MANSPNTGKGAVLYYTVYSEGKAAGNLFRLISASVYKAVNRIGKATLVFEAGDIEKAEVRESDDDTFAVGKKIRLEAGYDGEESPVFEGIVTAHNLYIREGNEANLTIECRDYAFASTLGRKNRLFAESSDSDAIKKILGEYSDLSPATDDTSTVHNELVQYYCTDWDFILSRADANGLLIITEGKNISIKKPETSGSPVLTVKYGTDLIEFEGSLNASDQIEKITASAWNPSAQEWISASGAAPSLNEQGNSKPGALSKAVGGTPGFLQTVGTVDAGSLTAWANATLLKTGLSRIRGSVKFAGTAKAQVGKILELDGFGKRFNGNAYIGSVVHEIEKGEWFTTVEMGIDPENITERPDVVAPPASGFLPGISGLHIGKVVKLSEDPLKENRIQVEIPSLNGEKNQVWARLNSLWASPAYGAFFIPDAGDEVIVGFFNNDPCYPVVLGSLYSSKQAPPYPLTEENHTRGIVTKEKMKVTFDEEKKVIVIETPGKNKIEISDEAKGITLSDQNSNSIQMNDSGITIKSAKDITIKADQNLKIEAGMKIEAKASSDLSMKGMNVEVKADVGLTAKGSATAELSASGQTTVKGAMVMIN